MRVGIILTGFNMEEYVSPCLDAWVRARRERLGGHEFVICAVSLPFAGFPNDTEDDTTEKLVAHLVNLDIDRVISEPRNVPETTARGMALQYLDTREVDVVWQVDLDEFYTTDDITRILTFVTENPWTAWFRIALKNYVFDDRTYLAEPFCPPRIHRMMAGTYRAHSFSADNDIAYGGTITRDILNQDHFPSMGIPHGVAWVKHLTWQSNDRSRRKVEYQWRRWNTCSFIWDDTKGLIFNPALPAPKVVKEP